MSRWGKILFFFAWITLAVVFAIRYVLGGWIDWLYAPLILALLSFVGACIVDIKFYLEFFTMRTTKHGLNMGTIILLVLAGLVSVNILAVRKNKIWDLTEDKLFSLSQQSVDVLKPIKGDIQFTIFYRGEKSRDALNTVRETLRPYEEISNSVQVVFYDTYLENLKAQEYLNSLPDKDSANNQIFLFAEHEGKRERIQSPFTETEITSALVKITRKSSSKIYFLTGHNERDLDSEGEEGFKAFKNELEQYASQPETLNLLQGGQVPADASALVIAGPKAPLLDGEIEAIYGYLRGGGKLIVMADPGEPHNLSPFLKGLGVEFSNTYVVNGGLQVSGVSQVTAVGLEFDQTNDITKPFQTGNTFALFHLASEVRKSPQSTDITVQDLVKTSSRSFALSELSESAKRSEMRNYTLAVAVKGKLKDKEGKESDKEFSAIVFGDSDFATNKLISLPTNQNLLMNSVASLSGQSDLISIRPKQPKSTKLVMTSAKWLGVVSAGLLLPTALLVLGSLVWFRRRSA